MPLQEPGRGPHSPAMEAGTPPGCSSPFNSDRSPRAASESPLNARAFSLTFLPHARQVQARGAPWSLQESCETTVSPRMFQPLGKNGFFNHEKPTWMLGDGDLWCLDQTHKAEPGPSLTPFPALVMLEPQTQLFPGKQANGQPRASLPRSC